MNRFYSSTGLSIDSEAPVLHHGLARLQHDFSAKTIHPCAALLALLVEFHLQPALSEPDYILF